MQAHVVVKADDVVGDICHRLGVIGAVQQANPSTGQIGLTFESTVD